MSLSPAQLLDFIRALTAATERWAHLVARDPDPRIYEQIWDDEDVNAWVICSNQDADTGFHDHDLSAAAIAVVSEVREDRLALNGPPLAHLRAR